MSLLVSILFSGGGGEREREHIKLATKQVHDLRSRFVFQRGPVILCAMLQKA